MADCLSSEDELPSAEDSISGASSRLSASASAKVRLPPPLAPKPNKRASTGASASPSAPSAGGGTAATDAPKPGQCNSCLHKMVWLVAKAEYL